jgi:hypothetical protein
LEWSTASEVGIAAFDVKCKRADEPDDQYHSIGLVQSKGGPNVGALYTFPVTSGVSPGVAYCFRLQEITTDGSQGEAIDRCGYGPAVTPTPGLGAILTFTPVPPGQAGVVPTPIPPVPGIATPVPGAVVTDPFGNPVTATPFTPGAVPVDPFGSPLPAPSDAGFPTPFLPTPALTDPFGSPLPPPDLPGTSSIPGDPMASAFPEQQFPPVSDPMAAAPTDPATGLPIDPMAAAPTDPATGLPIDPMAAALTVPESVASVATPTAEYLVVTATPTLAPVALAPVMTPLPTTTPMPSTLQVADALAPTTQNLMIMLLCLTFTGASGIGILGLITSVMYMRSRTSQREFFDQYSRRR